MNPYFFFEEKYSVRAYEIDVHKRMTAPALLRLMHETAQQQVVQMKLSVWDLEPHHISWVLVRIHFEIVRLPLLGEEIIIKTNPAGFEKVFTFRDYKVYDLKGNLLAWASSTWLLMNTQTRKLTRIPDFIANMEMPDSKDFLPHPVAKLPQITSPDHQLNFRVNWYDLDFNQHLNNMFYLQWMLESTPVKTLKTNNLREINLIYKQECHHQEMVQSQTQQIAEQHFLHRLIKKETGQEIAQGESFWKPLS